ncbi:MULTISPECIES: toxin-antitoxin system TumE family protein [Xanthomonas]|uniref:toxin-antitoxin system TumE family protein n=1 Tax=Xanthomonas TaxID=338 RepID=UPI002B226974|nr:DUF6516 family protein [Xanthomonas campestris]MEA9761791.1 DUF6516 family protein [Xanthomonas campestris pv. raphani]MEA9814000.1 DUF6516 family protein [Xanthomonas campestris pv. raphani]MEA9907105.1 DUF6516 family protein [Xanthomonas campestris pv. raphani]MEA9923402.1 DUF6516 family protein [Xanthomonas campestris pv. raphani]MEA9935789.1 DUF6516 family protein [Xanthomonas campestris pv. raphani]
MIGDGGLAWLIDESGTYRLTCGWLVVIRAEWCDVSVGRPQGLDYGLVLQDEQRNRILGFDNSHAFDNAKPNDPFDHEHRVGKTGQRFQYVFVSPGKLLEDFWARMETYCVSKGFPFEFEDGKDE